MAAVPKRKHSKGRRDRRRSHDALDAVNLTKCGNCSSLKPQHQICKVCGHYAGAQVMNVK